VSKNLVIVESPAKAKTIEKYLGNDFKVLASFGHVRDLLPKEGAVDPEHDFAMNYQLIEKNAKYVDEISKFLKNAETLYLATDPDREGEAISWHLCEILKDRKLINNKPVHRVVFHQITQQAVQQAIANPRQLSMELVNAQQARRALDYLVGFNLSPLLWKKILPKLSAGRVQSPALRLIAEREEEIDKFQVCEYWTIEADCKKGRQSFIAKLNGVAGKKLKQCPTDIKNDQAEFTINNEEQATELRDKLLQLANGQLQVAQIEKKQRKRQPAAPFTTSTLQQEAARKLNFTSKNTMMIAQQLYEGIDTGNGAVGLITYMRTDSVNLANEAVVEIRNVISELYGPDLLPKQPREYKTKAKNAQEAHEAIRPTAATHYPEHLQKYLTSDQLKLYTLIWRRTLACQMVDAKLDTVAVDLNCGDGNNFHATGSMVVVPGFMKVYQEGVDDKEIETDDKMLPSLEMGEWVKLKHEKTGIRAEQHFTEPPPRFSEASLVKSLEEYGIGRPSTYATIISTLQQRKYVVLEKKRFIPTDIGRLVNKFLTQHFTQYVDYDFTAKLEDQLDAVSRGEQDWIPLMRRFWTHFKQLIDEKAKTVQRKDIVQESLEEKCPKCGNTLTIRIGRRGRFIGCSGYPNCDYTRNVEEDAQGASEQPTTTVAPEVVEGRSCPLCNSQLLVKQGRYGKFIGCSNYPKCKHMEPLEAATDSGVTCPACGKGTLVKKKSRYGTFFYSCSSYPTCKYAISNEPIAETCPNCNWPILMLKTTKKRGTEKVCPQKGCNYVQPVENQIE
jgi:DNA topoisomerase-1